MSTTSPLLAFTDDQNVDLFHSDVYYARAHLVYNTDFCERYGYKPTLDEIEKTMHDMKWLAPQDCTFTKQKKRRT